MKLVISCCGLVFARLATVRRPTIVCLGSGHPAVYTAYIIITLLVTSIKVVFQKPMGPLQLAVTWYKIRHAGEQATHWDIKTKKIQICLDEVALFWMPQWTACSPAWRILYHVTASCKGPITI